MATQYGFGYRDPNELQANTKAKNIALEFNNNEFDYTNPFENRDRRQKSENEFVRRQLDAGYVKTGDNTWESRANIENQNAQNYASASQADAYMQGVANQQGIVDTANQYASDAYRIGQSAENLPTVDDLVYKNLRGAASGTDVPFNAATQAALMTNAAQSNQASTNNQLQQLQEQAALTGANPSDPSYQAAMRKAQSQAQSNMQSNRNSIAMQAGTANYAAKQQATQGLTNLQSQLANQAIAGRNQALNAYQSGANAKTQALSMPVTGMSADTAAGIQHGGGQGTYTAGNYKLPTYQQWTQSAKANPWKT